MHIGFVGLGKLGLPVATAMQMRGHNVLGYDIDHNVQKYIDDPSSVPYQECGPDVTEDFRDYLRQHPPKLATLDHIAETCDIIFVAVQTPHEPRYEGITLVPFNRVDFDYSILRKSVADLVFAGLRRQAIIVIISTCLPGTMRREIMPLIPSDVGLAYNPYWIAMGTTMWDFLNPEQILLGADEGWILERVSEVYDDMDLGGYVRQVSIESAEVTKVLYNTWISSKIGFSCVVGEICHKIPGADHDEVMGVLHGAKYRIISENYMNCGMGDGGGCHPRDNIALSFLSRKHNLHFDWFDMLIKEREEWAGYLAALCVNASDANMGLPIAILGYAFKANTNLTDGSHALLVDSILRARGHNPILCDSHVNSTSRPCAHRSVFLIGCNHPEYRDLTFPGGSVVIDPWRYIPDQEGVKVIRIGERQ